MNVSLLKYENALILLKLDFFILKDSIFESIFSAAGISNSGSSVKDTLIVSPKPSESSVPIHNADFILPSRPSPASVTPR